jgi:hypothetical protein
MINEQTLTAWEEAKSKLDHYKALELELRTELIKQGFGEEVGREGTQTVELTEGKVKAVFKVSRTLTEGKELDNAIKQIQKTEHGELIAKRLIKWKPELVVSEYRKLTKQQLVIINKVLTVKDSTPSLTFCE